MTCDILREVIFNWRDIATGGLSVTLSSRMVEDDRSGCNTKLRGNT